MAIDSVLFMADIPAGTVAVGDTFTMQAVDGSPNVRAGRGAALLKRCVSFKVGATGALFVVDMINSDWIDPVTNEAPTTSNTTMDRRTGAYQSGNDCPLTQNSTFTCTARCVIAGTATAGTIMHIVEIDYPQVSSIIDPDTLPGIPTSISMQGVAVTEAAAGSGIAAAWTSVNTDFFKAGYEYALQKVSAYGGSTNAAMFISISNAAGMGGLQRIIPVVNSPDSIRAIVEYASKLQKGPMEVKVKAIGTAQSDSVGVIFDFVKRRM